MSSRVFIALLAAVVVVALGYGVVLPVLPTMVAELTGASDSTAIARHVGWLTAAYIAAPLVTAILWGRLSDSVGRKPIIVLALFGFAVTLAATALAPNLAMLYIGRILNGAFAAGVVPTVLALIADVEADDDRRARAFGAVGMASIAGFFFGPMLGGFAADWGGRPTGSGPFLAAAILAVVAAVSVSALLSAGTSSQHNQVPRSVSAVPLRGGLRLLVLAAVVAGGLGAFEVGLTLRTGDHAMTPGDLGIMFAACSIVMFAVQGVVFSPLVKASLTRWVIAPAFAVMALGLALIPGAMGLGAVLAMVSIVSGSAGVLAPLLAYWLAKTSQRSRGVGLGIQSAATSLGQSVGSAGAGLLYGLNGQEGAAFFASAAIMAIAAIASLSLPGLLAHVPSTARAAQGSGALR